MPVAKQVEPTKRQREVYEFIRSKIQDRGYGPTVRETAAAFGIRSPNGVMCHFRALEKKRLIRRERHMSRAIRLLADSPTKTGLPLAGVIAAGQPLEAVEQPERLDFGQVFSGPDMFVLEVRGQSMIEDHIAEGDYVVVRKQPTARNGQIIVALLADGEATLKRYYRTSGGVRLEPANSSMKPIVTRDVKILGVVVGVVRRYT